MTAAAAAPVLEQEEDKQEKKRKKERDEEEREATLETSCRRQAAAHPSRRERNKLSWRAKLSCSDLSSPRPSHRLSGCLDVFSSDSRRLRARKKLALAQPKQTEIGRREKEGERLPSNLSSLFL